MQKEKHAMEKIYEIVQLFADLSMQVIEAVCGGPTEAFTIAPFLLMKAP
jgi:hypothetical protein